jgi:hypothetical protein
MSTHVKVIAWLYIVLGALGLFGAAIAALAIIGGGLISADRTAIAITSIVGIVIATIIVVLSIPGMIAGAGLLRYRPWARILALVLAVLNLPGFPTGTLLGIYTIWALLDDETSRLFGPNA